MIKLEEIRQNEENPRRISMDELERLKRSIDGFREMMEAEPIVVDEDGMILGGNMRYAAIVALGMTEIPETWVRRAVGWTKKQKREFIIKDNVHFGEWDWNVLANEWPSAALAEWGVPVPQLPDEIPALVDYGEEIADEVPTVACPHCGHRFVR